MARLEFSSAINVKTKPERAFDYFADHRHVAQVLEGVSRWEPIGARTKGLGARYKVEMLAFGIPLKNVLRLDRSERPDGVRIELRIAYEPPAAVLGAAVARRLDGVIRRRLETALERIRKVLESESLKS